MVYMVPSTITKKELFMKIRIILFSLLICVGLSGCTILGGIIGSGAGHMLCKDSDPDDRDDCKKGALAIGAGVGAWYDLTEPPPRTQPPHRSKKGKGKKKGRYGNRYFTGNLEDPQWANLVCQDINCRIY